MRYPGFIVSLGVVLLLASPVAHATGDVEKGRKIATPFTVTQDEIDYLVAFVKTLKSWKRPPRRRRR